MAFLWGRAVSVDLYHLNRQMLCWKPNRNFIFFKKKKGLQVFFYPKFITSLFLTAFQIEVNMNKISAIQVKIGGKRRPRSAPPPPLHTTQRAACRAFESPRPPPFAHGPKLPQRRRLSGRAAEARSEAGCGRGAAGAALKESDGDCSEAQELCGTV